MIHQTSFLDLALQSKSRVTRREIFLSGMERVVPWAERVALIEPVYPKGQRGRPPIGIERMLRLYFIQLWNNFSDEATEGALYDMSILARFVGIDVLRDRVPDATTLMNFRHRLEAHQLAPLILDRVNALLEAQGLLLREGTIVDATLIAAPPSIKNQDQQRDPDMHQTKKGNHWHFGMKMHIGVDASSGLTHTAVGTAANVSDVVMAGLNASDPHINRRFLRTLPRCRLALCAWRGGDLSGYRISHAVVPICAPDRPRLRASRLVNLVFNASPCLTTFLPEGIIWSTWAVVPIELPILNGH